MLKRLTKLAILLGCVAALAAGCQPKAEEASTPTPGTGQQQQGQAGTAPKPGGTLNSVPAPSGR